MTDVAWITGAGGFSGRCMVRHLAALPDRPRIVGLDLTADGAAEADASFAVDLNDADHVADLARRHPPRWVAHLAGAMPPASDAALWQGNAGATAGLLTGLMRADLDNVRVLSIGSAAEYRLDGDAPIDETCPTLPASTYGRTKWVQSSLVLAHATAPPLQAMVARPFNLVGPGLGGRHVIGAICRQLAAPDGPDELVLGNVAAARDFIDVRDAVAAYWAIVRDGHPGRVYNVCSGEAVSIRQIVDQVAALLGRELTVRSDPDRIRPNDPPRVVGDATRLRTELGWRPAVPLRRSLNDMLAWSSDA